MNEIPKELQGTKAVPFLEWLQKLEPEVYISPHEDIENYCYNYSQINSIMQFYSQPFTPEMIVKYFEGWKAIKPEYYGIKGNPTLIRIISPENAVRYDNKLDLYPQTLNDFISDCNRAGINDLTFKTQ